MAVQTVVRILGQFMQDDEATLERRYGPQAVALAQELESMLAIRLREESPYATLWQQFESQPQTAAAGLTGALEALVEADPALARRLEAFVEEYHRLMGSSEELRARRRMEEQELLIAGDVPRPTTAPADAYDVGGGTYLYGNVGAGRVSTAEDVRGVSDGYEGRLPVEGMELNIAEVASIFEPVEVALKTHPDISSAVEAQLKVELAEMQAQVARGDQAEVEKMVHHLHNIGRLAPDILEILLSRLTDLAPGSRGTVQKAVAKLQESVNGST
jgi:hypothetical protein